MVGMQIRNESRSNLPIGIFDSGVGGVTVLKALQREFPGESFLYLGDTARLPYGSKSPLTIRNYLEQNVNHLLKHGVKALVVACNSASSILKSSDHFGVPHFDVIRPGARAAVSATRNKRIGVVGTAATVSSNSYVKAIAEFGKFDVFQQPCPLLVPLVEEGLVDDPITNLIVYRYLGPLLQIKMDTLILGCTHYPVIEMAFRKVVGSSVAIVDSSKVVADRLRHSFETGKIPSAKGGEGSIRLMVTDDSPAFRRVAQLILGDVQVASIEFVHLEMGSAKETK